MTGSGEEQREYNSTRIQSCNHDRFLGCKITSDTGFLLLRAIDERGDVEKRIKEGKNTLSAETRRVAIDSQPIKPRCL